MPSTQIFIQFAKIDIGCEMKVQREDILGIAHALNNLAQIELSVKIDGGYTILQSRVTGNTQSKLAQAQNPQIKKVA
jgi:hypothetical protein